MMVTRAVDVSGLDAAKLRLATAFWDGSGSVRYGMNPPNGYRHFSTETMLYIT